MGRIQVSDKHPDHYLDLKGVSDDTAVWWDGFTGLQIVVCELPMLSWCLGASHLVSVVDRYSQQTWAWAFDTDAAQVYIREKMPRKMFHRLWAERLAESIQMALKLHSRATRPQPVAADA